MAGTTPTIEEYYRSCIPGALARLSSLLPARGPFCVTREKDLHLSCTPITSVAHEGFDRNPISIVEFSSLRFRRQAECWYGTIIGLICENY